MSANADRLTPRQRQVLVALYRTRNIKAAAYQLGMAVETARVHRAEAYRRLGVHDAIDAYQAIGLIREV